MPAVTLFNPVLLKKELDLCGAHYRQACEGVGSFRVAH